MNNNSPNEQMMSKSTVPSGVVGVNATRPAYLDFADWVVIISLNYAATVKAAQSLGRVDSTIQALMYAVITILLILMLFTFCPKTTAPIKSPPIGIALLIFASFSALSIQLSVLRQIRYDGEDMWRQLLLALLPMGLFWAARFWAAHHFRSKSIEIGLMMLLFLCAASVLLDFTGLLPFEGYGSRHFGFLGDSVAWLATAPTVYFLLRGRAKLLALGVIVALLTQTRAAAVVIIAAIVINIVFSPVLNARTYAIRFAAVIVGVVAALAAQSLTSDFLDRFTSVSLTDNDRIRTIQFTLDVFMDHPMFGSGFNAHTYFFAPSQAAAVSGVELWATPVSTFAQILADAGLVGFLPFIAAMAMLGRVSFQALRLDRRDEEATAVGALASWLLGYIIFNQSAAWLLPGSMMPSLVFVMAGVVVGATGQKRAAA